MPQQEELATEAIQLQHLLSLFRIRKVRGSATKLRTFYGLTACANRRSIVWESTDVHSQRPVHADGFTVGKFEGSGGAKVAQGRPQREQRPHSRKVWESRDPGVKELITRPLPQEIEAGTPTTRRNILQGRWTRWDWTAFRDCHSCKERDDNRICNFQCATGLP